MTLASACQTALLCLMAGAVTTALPTAEGEPAERPSPLQSSPAMGSVVPQTVLANQALGEGPQFGATGIPSWLTQTSTSSAEGEEEKIRVNKPVTEEVDPGPEEDRADEDSDAITEMFGSDEDTRTPTLADERDRTDASGEGKSGDETDEAADISEAAKKITAYKQPVADYDYATGSWLPARDQAASGWMRELAVPQQLIDCTCNGRVPGRACRIWRSYVKPTDPSVDQNCVACVKEPCMDYETVEEVQEAVVYRCFENEEPFEQEGCESGEWFHKKGTKRIRKLYPCKVKVPIKYQKPVVTYRDVWYYIQCDSAERSY